MMNSLMHLVGKWGHPFMLLRGTLVLLLVLAGTVVGQENDDELATLREKLILGEIKPQAYTQSHNVVKTEFETAIIAGLPVRQHPVNLGLFQIGGCEQCHRINAPLPRENSAPPDVFAQLAERFPISNTAPPSNHFTRLSQSSGREEFPVWSPDGEHILYSADNNDNHWNLWLVSADGSNSQQLTFALSAGWPSWSPDGKHIVYWESDQEHRGNIWTMDADGSNKQQLTFEEMTAFPQWSPTGNQLVYQARRDGKWSIWLVSPDGSSSNPISPENQFMVGSPQWSPDGTQIFYQARAGKFFEPWRLIFRTGEDGKPDYASPPDAHPSSSLLPMDIGLGQGIGTWSPDGQRVAYLMVDLQTLPTGQNALTYKTWLSDIDGSNPSLLMPNGTIADRDPTWSPDGTKIAFASNRAGTFDIWIANVSILLSSLATNLQTADPPEEPSEVFCALRSTGLSLDSEQEASGQLIVTSEVSVIEDQGEWVKVRLEGWQEDGTSSLLYALPGLRIRKAQLGEALQDEAEIRDMYTDPITEILWNDVLLDGMWVPREDLTNDLAPVWEEAAQLFESTCSLCHELHHPEQFFANQWPSTMEEMGVYINLDKNSEEFKLMASYLQYNARDTKDLAGVVPCEPKTQD